MRVTPVERRAEPSYPTRDYLNEHPELLYLVPERWRHNRLVLAALGGVLSLSLACQRQALDVRAVSRVAPIFAHGSGRGAFGCVAVNPPVFLTEDEGRQAIQDEARKAGLEFAPDALTIHGAAVPITDRFRGPQGTKRRDLVLDGYDRKRNVAYEFVSYNDFDDWEQRQRSGGSSVSDFDLKRAAATLRTGLAEKEPQAWVAVFYEPAAQAPDNGARLSTWEQRQKAARRLGEEELRWQVRDFIKWLKAQGVI